jgi:hypothetical protein
MCLRKWCQTIISLFEQQDIHPIVFDHILPALRVAIDATFPQIKVRLDLATESKLGTKIIQRIRVVSGNFLGELLGINRLERARRKKTMNNETSYDHLYIKRISVMGDDYVRLVEQFPKVRN